MTVGTKSILFGIHQFFLHPLFVVLAWRKIYGKWPRFREAVCIVVHDLGYFGKPNMDGNEGKRHPILGGLVAGILVGSRYSSFTMCHSRDYAQQMGAEVSSLCLPDKMSILFYPDWLYILLGNLSGEINEYKRLMNLAHMDDFEWLACLKEKTLRWVVANSTWQQKKRLERWKGIEKIVQLELDPGIWTGTGTG